MFHSVKKLGLALVLATGVTRSIFGFSLLGPINEAFQVNTIGYNLQPPVPAFANDNGVDIGAPKNLGEGYRWNTPVLFYAYDANFLDYFGSNGVVAVDSAVGILNSLGKVSSYSSDLSEWPLVSTRQNYSAQAAGLLDLRSATLSMLIEELGLAQPDRWAWCLHDRFPIPGAPCPNFIYTVIQRNFDPVTHFYSPYVNGVLYDFIIVEFCTLNPNPFAPLEADAIELPPDNTASVNGAFDAVASYPSLLNYGVYFKSLTRDDIGGLRYLYSSNNINTEVVSPDSQVLFTNFQSPTILSTSNLAVLSAEALTNPPNVFSALHPEITITSVSNYWGYQYTTNFFFYFTNLPNAPFGASTLVLFTNRTTNLAPFYVYQFGNVVTNHYYTKGFVRTVEADLTGDPNSPVGSTTLKIISDVTKLVPYTNGDYYVIPPGVSSYITNTGVALVTVVTNLLVNSLNSGPNGEIFNLAVLTFFTNYQYGSYPIQLLSGTNSVALRPGIEKINFVRQDYDPLLSSTWNPVTNIYTLAAINTNNVRVTNTYVRIVNNPDFLFTVQDLAAGPAAAPANSPVARQTPFYNSTQALRGLAGPGTMSSSASTIFMIFNKSGDLYDNELGFFINGITTAGDTNNILSFNWGTFDGTTNEPVVYPNDVSFNNLLTQSFFQITSALLPNGSVSAPLSNGTNYITQLQAQAAQPPATPYTWQLAPNSAGFPAGLGWDTGGSTSTTGIITGAPTVTGTYDFTVQASYTTAGVTTTTTKELFVEIDP